VAEGGWRRLEMGVHSPKPQTPLVVIVFPNEYAKVQRRGKEGTVRISHGRFRLHNYVY